MGLTYKPGVRPSKPFLPDPPVFEADDSFREWLLTKCTVFCTHTAVPHLEKLTTPRHHRAVINAELASLHSPEFLSILRRTRRELLREIIQQYDAKLLK